MNTSHLRKRDWHSLNVFLKVVLVAVGICLFATKFASVETAVYLGETKVHWFDVYLLEEFAFLVFVVPIYPIIAYFLMGEDLVNNRLMSIFLIIGALMHFSLSAIWAIYIAEGYTVPLGNYLLLTIFPLVTLIYNVQQARRMSDE